MTSKRLTDRRITKRFPLVCCVCSSTFQAAVAHARACERCRKRRKNFWKDVTKLQSPDPSRWPAWKKEIWESYIGIRPMMRGRP